MSLQAPNETTSPVRRNVRLGLILAGSHFLAFLLSAAIAQQQGGWLGVFVWPIWLVIDLPWSLPCYLVVYQTPLNSILGAIRLEQPVLDYLLYPPYLIHGFVGTVWWGCMPRAYIWFMRRRLTVNRS